jgi:sensor domain CHASE-containing protein
MPKRVIIIVTSVVLTIFVLAVLVFAFVIRPMATSAAAPCVNRLMQIEAAKVEWALEHNKTTNDVPTWDDIYPYLSSDFTNRWFTNGRPVCPEGGTYTLGRVGVPPTCSIGGSRHSIP